MSPTLRKALIGLGALIAVLVIGIAILLATFDPNRYKSVAIDWMKSKYDRTLAIDGDIGLSVFPRVAVRIGGVRLSEAGRSDPFAAIGEAALAVEVLPLLSRQLVIDRIEATGVRATLTRDAKGKRNIDDLLAPSAAASAPASGASAPGASGAALKFDVSRILVRDAQLKLRDETAALDGALTLERLETGRIASGVRAPVKLAATFDFQQPALQGTLKGSFDVTPDLDKGSAALADLELDYAGTVPGGLKLSGASIGAKRLAYAAESQLLAIEALKVRAKGEQAGAPIAAELDWPQLDLRGNQLKGSGLAGKLERGGAQEATVIFKTGAPEGSFDALRIPGLDAQISAVAGGQKLAGAIRGQLAVQAPRKTAQWTLAGNVAKNNFETNGSVAWAGAAPTLRAQARFDSLDLNTLMPPPSANTNASTTATPADPKVDLSALNAFNGSLNLRAGRIVARQVTVADARLDASVEAGVLKLSTLQGKAWGGQLDASGSADAKRRSVGVKATAAGVNIAALLKDIADKDLLEGSGRVTLDVTSSGQTVGELRSRLGGNAALRLTDGAVKGVNLAKTLRQAKAAISTKQDAAVRAQRTEQTDFSELTASFRIDNGIARSNDLDLKSPFLRLGGDGAVDVGKSRIDYTARATVVETSAGQGGDDLAALKGLTIPVRLTGPLEAVEWNIQWSAVAAGALKGKAEEKLKEKLGISGAASAPAPKEQLKEKLLDKLLKKK